MFDTVKNSLGSNWPQRTPMGTSCVRDIENISSCEFYVFPVVPNKLGKVMKYEAKIMMSIIYLETSNIKWGQIDPKGNRRVKCSNCPYTCKASHEIRLCRKQGRSSQVSGVTHCLPARRTLCSWVEAGGALPGDGSAPWSKLALLSPQSPARHVPLWQDQRLTPGRETGAHTHISIQTHYLFAYIWMSIMAHSKAEISSRRAQPKELEMLRVFKKTRCW